MNSPAAGEVSLELDHIERTFEQGGTRLEVLRGASLRVKAGEAVALVAPSGAGKSTLLHIAGLLERADEGEVRIAGIGTSNLSDGRRTELRRRSLGFVYQFHHLLPEFSALENVILPQMIAGSRKRMARKRAHELLDMLGLAARETHRPARLSGGEQQRVAIARALANQPQVLLADEPTGNLDRRTADDVFAALMKIVRETRTAALIATHNPELAARMDRRVTIEDGLIKTML